MPMSPRLLRPTQNQHPEAADWANRVRTNGGTVSGSTLLAVSRFCRAIDAAGIRDRFYRLNLFCGTGLNAALVPLYRGPTRTGTQFGNTTDTNFNFVSGDYAENIGLTGTGNNGVQAGNSKHLRTGLQPASVGLFSGHLSAWARNLTTGLAMQGGIVGIRDNASPQQRWWLDYRQTVIIGDYSGGTFFGFTTPVGTRFVAVSRTTATDLRHYIDGAKEGATQTTDITASAVLRSRDWYVFALNLDGAPSGYYSSTLGGYSIGLGMTDTQMSNYNVAMQALQTALGRT